jgi:hypothetical protein
VMHRAVDWETAQEVAVAETLANLGAGAALIERLTGFGSRWVRDAVRRHAGPLAQKPRDALKRFGRDPTRLLHGWMICIVMYEYQPAYLSEGARLVEAYSAYRGIAQPPGILDINECAQIIELYQSNNAWVQPCLLCHRKHLVLSERTVCALCATRAIMFCKVCGEPLEHRDGRSRTRHRECQASAAKQNRSRRAARGGVADPPIRWRDIGKRTTFEPVAAP